MLSATDSRDVSMLAALADPIRLEIVKRLSRVREIAGAELAETLGISRALLCHHTGILVGAGVAAKRKAGQTAYLRLNAARLRRCIRRLDRRAGSAKKLVTGRERRTGGRPPSFERSRVAR
jgi:DNA-binding transcriptional ArsR family regulator